MPMGYRGKTTEQHRARELRTEGWTYSEICREIGVSKASVSLWCRDVIVDEDIRSSRVRANRNEGARLRRPHRQALARQAEIERLLGGGRVRIGVVTERESLVAGTALYAGEGGKTDGAVTFPNSDARMIVFFLAWLRRFFEVDESRLRVALYLHEGLDLNGSYTFWSTLTGIPTSQFTKPYRAVPDKSIRRAKHPMGCPRVSYSCSSTHRAIMGFVSALLSCSDSIPGW